eukprot:scaffold44550_cov54-Cyclotella_meneghiniana.AAC.2
MTVKKVAYYSLSATPHNANAVVTIPTITITDSSLRSQHDTNTLYVTFTSSTNINTLGRLQASILYYSPLAFGVVARQ